MHHKVEYYNFYNPVTDCLRGSFGSQNEQPAFHYTTLHDLIFLTEADRLPSGTT